MDGGTAEAWLISFTTQLRAQLPSSDYIITHARSSPQLTSLLTGAHVNLMLQPLPPGMCLHEFVCRRRGLIMIY